MKIIRFRALRSVASLIGVILSNLILSQAAHALDVNVSSYGANGSDTIDDRAAIQRAIDAVSDAGGGKVSFPSGTFYLSIVQPNATDFAWPKALTIYPKVVLQGAGQSSTTLKLLDNQAAYGNILGPGLIGSDVSGFSMYDLGVDHNSDNNPSPASASELDGQTKWQDSRPRCTVYIASATDITIRRCKFLNVRATWGIFVGEGGANSPIGNVNITNNTWSNVGGGTVDFDSSVVYISGRQSPCRVLNNSFSTRGVGTLGQRTAIEVHSFNQIVKGNTISNFLIGINTGGVSYEGSKSHIIDRNTIHNAFAGITIWPTNPHAGGAGQINCSVTNNSISLDLNGWQNLVSSGGSYANGINVAQQNANDASMFNVDICKNTVTYTNFAGTRSYDRYSSGIAFNRNDSVGGDTQVTNLHINSNTINNGPAMGIYVNASINGLEIADNQIKNIGQNSSLWDGFRSGILLTGTQSNLSVSKNTFTDNQSIQTTKNSIYAYNDVSGTCVEYENTFNSGAIVFARDSRASGTWTRDPTGPRIPKFYLYYADGSKNGQPVTGLDPFVSGSVINLAKVSNNLAIRVVGGFSPVGSMRLGFDAGTISTAVRNEEWFYFYLGRPAVGDYTLTAAPFSGPDLTGTAGVSRNIVFKVINDPSV